MKQDKTIDVLDKELPSSNRLSAQFDRVKNKKANKTVDLSEVQEGIEKNIYINTKDSQEKSSELDYSLKKLNYMGKGSHKLLETLYPSIKHDRIEKKNKKTKYTSVAFPAAIVGMMVAPTIASKFSKPIKNILGQGSSFTKNKNKEETHDPENMFGLSSNDKDKLKQLQAKTGDQHASMDKVIRIISAGSIVSLPALIFNFTNYKNSGIYLLFKKQLEKFQTGALELFTKIFNNTINWIKENLYDPIIGAGGAISAAWTKLKNKAINKINALFKTELANEPIVSTEPIDSFGPTLVGSLREMVLSYVGKNNDNASKDLEGNLIENKKSFVDKIKDKANEFANSLSDDGSQSFDTGEEFIGLPKGSSLNTTSGMQLGIYSGLRKAGFNDNQARILTAEIGREGSYLAKNVFGVHGDPANGSGNLGMLSWQKDRFGQLVKWMQSAGLMKGRKMQPSQASIDMQAKFIMHEIRNNSRYKRTKKLFLENPNVSYNVAKEVLGTNYIRWRYNDSKYRSGHKNRDAAYVNINKQLKNQQNAGTGDMNWNIDNSKEKLSVEAKQSDRKKLKPVEKVYDFNKSDHISPKLIKNNSPIFFANDNSEQINTINNPRQPRHKRNNITDNFARESVQQVQSSFTPNLQNTNQMSKNTNQIGPQYQPQQSSVNSSEAATTSGPHGDIGYKNPIKSLYQIILEKDLSGNMF